jgi:hypothetical protein
MLAGSKEQITYCITAAGFETRTTTIALVIVVLLFVENIPMFVLCSRGKLRSLKQTTRHYNYSLVPFFQRINLALRETVN